MIHYHVCAPASTAFEVNDVHFLVFLWGVDLRLFPENLLVVALYSSTLALCGDVVEFCLSLHINIPNGQGTTTSIQVVSLPLMPTPSTSDGYLEGFII